MRHLRREVRAVSVPPLENLPEARVQEEAPRDTPHEVRDAIRGVCGVQEEDRHPKGGTEGPQEARHLLVQVQWSVPLRKITT